MTLLFKQYMKFLSVMICAAVMVGCSSEDEAEANESASAVATAKQTTAYIEGRAVKGLIVSGVVNAYEIQFENGDWVAAEEPVTASVRTDIEGRYQISLTGESVGKEFVVEVTVDEQTRMRCELVNGCNDIDYADFGEFFRPAGDFVISTITPLISAERTTTAHVSLFTHLARAQAEASPNGLIQENFVSAIEVVEDMLSLEPGVSFREPVDLADIAELGAADQSLAEAGVIAAAFHEIAAGSAWASISDVVNHAGDRMAEHGTLSLANMGALEDVALDDIFYAGQVVASEFATNLSDNSALVSMMGSVEQGLSTQQQDAMDNASNITPVQFVSQPVSQSADSGSSVALSVGVIGTGPVVFQWYKDGNEIEGETESTLIIDSLMGTDSGNYTVIASNSVGSVRSMTATLTVNIVTHDITLSWDIPSEREDGSALALYEINGYVIRYGSSANDLLNELEVIGGAVTSQVVTELEAGSYYFEIATVDSDKVRGRFSDAVAVHVN